MWGVSDVRKPWGGGSKASVPHHIGGIQEPFRVRPRGRVEQVVVQLHRGELRPAVCLGHGLHVMELIGVHGAGTERSHLASFDQPIQCFHRFFDRCVVIETMNDVQIQIVGTQTFERAVDLTVDGFGGQVSFVEVHFAGQHYLLARNV